MEVELDYAIQLHRFIIGYSLMLNPDGHSVRLFDNSAGKAVMQCGEHCSQGRPAMIDYSENLLMLSFPKGMICGPV